MRFARLPKRNQSNKDGSYPQINTDGHGWDCFYAASVFLLCAVAAGCSKVESYEKPLTPVKVRAVEQQAVSRAGGAARYSAAIKPREQVDLAFKIGGYVDQILAERGRLIEEGDRAAKGAILARIKDADFTARTKQANAALGEARAAQSQARSQLAEAQTAHEQFKRELERAERLLEKESLTKPAYEAAKANVEMGQAKIEAVKAQLAMTEARVENARARIEEIESQRADCELKAPIAGLLLKRNIEIGSYVAPGAPAFVMADTTTVNAVFGVSDVAAAQLRPGSPLTVTTEAMHGVEFHGRLARVAPVADPKTRIFDVEVEIPNPGQRLKVGMVVSLQMAGGQMAGAQASASVAVAPLTALLQLNDQGGGYAVFTVEDQNGRQIARRRRVSLGETSGNMIAVTDGINVGEKVVVSGASMISDGQQVRVVQ